MSVPVSGFPFISPGWTPTSERYEWRNTSRLITYFFPLELFCTANFISSLIIKSFVLRMSKNFLGLINIDVKIIFKVSVTPIINEKRKSRLSILFMIVFENQNILGWKRIWLFSAYTVSTPEIKFHIMQLFWCVMIMWISNNKEDEE